MKLLTPNDALFLYGESREVMMHVGGLMTFAPSPDTPRDHLRHLMDEIRAGSDVQSPWNQRLRTPDLVRNPLQGWVDDPEVDLDYHVRRSALPIPGDERELGIIVSRLHSYPVDFHRPPWETHLIEGLEGGRFAMYVKVHHALVDGYSLARIHAHALSRDPDSRDDRLFFAVPPPKRVKSGEESAPRFTELLAAAREQLGATKSIARALRNLARSSAAAELTTPSQAPQSIFNVRISRNRRFATQKIAIDRMKAVARKTGVTLNDVLLALSSASLRRYLIERDALPETALIAMLPVSVRAKDDGGGGNSVGAILASLATHIADPVDRLAAIHASTSAGKKQLEGMSKAAIIEYSALLLAPAVLQMIPSVAGRVRPTFNVVISNVPGPDAPRYFRGAQLEASYPMSIPVHGQALNITSYSYAGAMCVGFTGCRDSVPHLQDLAVYFGEAMADLERGFKID